MASENYSGNPNDPSKDDIHSRIIGKARTGICTGVFYGSLADAMKISAEKLPKLDQSIGADSLPTEDI